MTNIFSRGKHTGDRYEIIDFLDAGGMQEVYIAYDHVLKKKVALKTPKNDHAEKRFRRSAVLSAKVNHPNVAKTLDYFEFNKRDVLIEELIEGISLDKALSKKYNYFDPYLLAQFGHHLSKGVAASHHAKVIHRDLKPGNIMIENTEGFYSFKITDFGIAKMAEKEFEEAYKDESSITGSQTMMGAIPYMAPELIQGPKNATAASDIWPIGAILYRFMTGEYPYGSGLSAIPKIHEAKLPPAPSYTYHKLSQYCWLVDEVWGIIKKCLKKNPNERPSADTLVEDFSGLCYGVFQRFEGTIKNFKTSTGNWGFIRASQNDIFFHRESFYGEIDDIIPGRNIEFSAHKGGGAPRAHPALPLKAPEI